MSSLLCLPSKGNGYAIHILSLFNRHGCAVNGAAMITINVRTKAIRLDPDTPVMATNQFGNATYGYIRGWLKPNYPVPAIQYFVEWDKERNRLITLRWWK